MVHLVAQVSAYLQTCPLLDLDQSQGARVLCSSNRETAMKKMSIIGVLMGAAMVCAAPISLNQSPDKGLSISLNSAEARIGRPLTPGSVAGVNRRVHRRGGLTNEGHSSHDMGAMAPQPLRCDREWLPRPQVARPRTRLQAGGALRTCDGDLSQRITLMVALILYKLSNATAGDAYHLGKTALAVQLQPAPAVGTRWN
jgi:hypothetical protein